MSLCILGADCLLGAVQNYLPGKLIQCLLKDTDRCAKLKLIYYTNLKAIIVSNIDQQKILSKKNILSLTLFKIADE